VSAARGRHVHGEATSTDRATPEGLLARLSRIPAGVSGRTSRLHVAARSAAPDLSVMSLRSAGSRVQEPLVGLGAGGGS